MSGTHNKLYYGNSYNYWKILDLFVDCNYFSFRSPNPTHLPKYQTLNPNRQFSQGILYVEYYFVHARTAWSQKFRLTMGPEIWVLVPQPCFQVLDVFWVIFIKLSPVFISKHVMFPKTIS